jgi:dihydroflavonol-4-reductase
MSELEVPMGGTVLVTGGTGYIAGWCILMLLQRGYEVRTTVRNLAKEEVVRAAVASAEADDRLTVFAADLTRDEGWDAVMTGCDCVLHVASPLGTGGTNDPNAYIGPAVAGTLRVLRAATKAGVKHVVMTSAAATARPPLRSGIASAETVWADPDDAQFDAYRRSKILAERAAWDFMRDQKTAFTTLLPGAVFGPVLTKDNLGSVGIIAGLLQGRPPGIPGIGFNIVDVRDLADLHIRAMLSPEAVGERFLAVGEFMWMYDAAQVLRAGLGARANKVPTRRLPNFAAKILSLFTPQLRAITPLLGVKGQVTNEKARRVLGFAPRPASETLIDCANSLLG